MHNYISKEINLGYDFSRIFSTAESLSSSGCLVPWFYYHAGTGAGHIFIPPYYYRDAISNNLLIAAVQGYDSEVERLISKGADVNFTNPEGATPLFFAVAGNHSGTVKKLLAYEPEIDRKTAYGESPLHIAVKNGNIEIAEILIRAGADIDITDDNGASSLHYASLSGDFT